MNKILGHEAARPFADALERVKSEGEDLSTLLEGLSRQTSLYGCVRSGDFAPALNLLSYDGLITDAACRAAVNSKNGGYDLIEMCKLLDVKSRNRADNQGEGR